jgi:hypothetical protein
MDSRLVSCVLDCCRGLFRLGGFHILKPRAVYYRLTSEVA